MKKITAAIILLIMTGCATQPPPQPPEPIGDFTPVNPDDVHISALKL